jgi:hypothetical protein
LYKICVHKIGYRVRGVEYLEGNTFCDTGAVRVTMVYQNAMLQGGWLAGWQVSEYLETVRVILGLAAKDGTKMTFLDDHRHAREITKPTQQ